MGNKNHTDATCLKERTILRRISTSLLVKEDVGSSMIMISESEESALANSVSCISATDSVLTVALQSRSILKFESSSFVAFCFSRSLTYPAWENFFSCPNQMLVATVVNLEQVLAPDESLICHGLEHLLKILVYKPCLCRSFRHYLA